MPQEGSRWDAADAAAAALALAFFAAISQPFGPVQPVWVSDTVMPLVPVAAALACLAASRRAEPGHRAGWLLVGAGVLSWGMGEAIWSIYELGLHRETPFPSWADAGYLLAVPLVLAGLHQLSPRMPPETRLRALLDGLLTACCLVFLTWPFVLEPIHSDGGDRLGLWLGILYPVTDILLATVVLLSFTAAPHLHRGVWTRLGLGVIAWAAADSAFAYLANTGAYASGHFMDAAWVYGFLLIGTAAWRARAAPLPVLRADPLRVSSFGVPGTLCAVAIALYAYTYGREGELDPFLIWLGLGFVAAVLLRQGLAQVEIRRLNRTLGRSIADLGDAQGIAQLGSWRWDPGAGMAWSPTLHRLLGLPASAKPSLDGFLAAATPLDAARLETALRATASGGPAIDMAVSVQRADGRARDLHVRAHAEPGGAVVGTAQDVTEPRRAEARFRALFHNAPDAMLLMDGSGRILLANPQAERMFGRAPGELLGQGVSELIPSVLDTAGPPGALPKATLPPAHRPWTAVRRGGATFPVEVSLSPIELDDALAVVATVRDVSERQRMDRLRREANHHEAEADRLRRESVFKSQFMNMAAHELNTPLTPIRLQLHALHSRMADRMDDPTRMGFAILERNVDRLVRLIQDTLDATRLQSGHLKVRREPADLGAAVREAADLYLEPMRSSGLQLTVTAPGPMPVVGDVERLAQVLSNLLSNALKFTPAGGQVRIEAGAEGGNAAVRVRDTGRGLRVEDLGRLFQPFVQLGDPLSSRHGTGLGLYISRGIVEQHGGSLEVSSAGPGQGCTFTVRVPLAAPRTHRAGASAGPAGRARPMPPSESP